MGVTAYRREEVAALEAATILTPGGHVEELRQEDNTFQKKAAERDGGEGLDLKEH